MHAYWEEKTVSETLMHPASYAGKLIKLPRHRNGTLKSCQNSKTILFEIQSPPHWSASIFKSNFLYGVIGQFRAKQAATFGSKHCQFTCRWSKNFFVF
jgi:hypothetical protein